MNEYKRGTITEENREESRKLRALWDTRANRMSQAEFGQVYEIGSQAAVGHFLNANAAISMKAAKGFARGLGCDIAAFSERLAKEASELAVVSGGSSKALFTPTQSAPPLPQEAGAESGRDPDLIINQYDVGGAMGSGGKLLLEAKSPGIIKSWRVDQEWLRLNVPIYTCLSNLCIVTGFGSSMKPIFNPGDPLLMDRGVNHVDHEGIYFFSLGDEGFIKIIQRVPNFDKPGFVLRIISKNKEDFPPYDISSKHPDFRVIGKILTVWRSEQY